MEKWTAEMIGPQFGKTALITGGVEGSGLEVAKELARKGAKVIICADDILKAETALINIKSGLHESNVSYVHLDLADLHSVQELSEKILEEHEALHILINNAEITKLDEKIKTAQGHEMIFGFNYLAHFALTARLFPLLDATPDSRIIFQSSPELSRGAVDFFDLDGNQFYDTGKAFSQSKLALLLFARELDRRLQATNIDMKSIPIFTGEYHITFFGKLLNFAMALSPKQAALPLLFAATSHRAVSGHFYGPNSFFELKSLPVELDCPDQAKNIQAAERLWEISEQMAGVEFSMRDLSNVIPFQGRGGTRNELFT